jgi:hypothetical protein
MATKKKSPAVSAEKAAIANVFGQAEVVPTKKAKPVVAMGNSRHSFEGYVALILAEKAIESAKGTFEQQFKSVDAFDYFHAEVVKTGSQPSAFEGQEGIASAQFQFKKRPQGFNEEIAKNLRDNHIPFDRNESIPERFVINPLLLQDQEKLGQLAIAMQKLGLDFPVVIKQEPSYKYQFNDASIAEIAKIKDPSVQADLLRSISSIAVAQAHLECGGNVLNKALEIIAEKGILDMSEDEE